jgi:succinyl-diaminopimelate desuccinylase
MNQEGFSMTKENAAPAKMMKTAYTELVAPYQEEALETLKAYVAIPSVYDEATRSKTAPFGAEVEKALAFVADLGKKLGFTVDRCDHYVTELSYGTGDKTLDIYAHSDVVPVKKENWKHDPFKVTQEDNVLYGRGTSDDKGPGIACLYAAKALLDKKRLGGYRLRFLFGGNEERDSLCLKHYFETMKKGYPTLGFSPDADFPLIYAEKSIYAYDAEYPVILPEVAPFALGDALNIVPAEATATIDIPMTKIERVLKSYLTLHPEVKAKQTEHTVTFYGHPYHGSMPWNGVNAGLHLLSFLGGLLHIPVLEFIYSMYQDGRGEAFGGNFKDSYFDGSSYNVGRIRYDGQKIVLSVNVRFPASRKFGDVTDNLAYKAGGTVIPLGGSDGFVADPGSDLVKILLGSYQKETGDLLTKPEAIGGGTYARESRNSVAFGSQFPGRDYRMHGDDEFFPLSDFYDAMQIYAHALDDLSAYLQTGKKPE